MKKTITGLSKLPHFIVFEEENMKRRTVLKTLRHWIIIVIAFSLSACSHYYYTPNIQNVPLFQEKNEVAFSTNIASGEESDAFELQAAYAVTDKMAVMANFMSASGSYDVNSGNGI